LVIGSTIIKIYYTKENLLSSFLSGILHLTGNLKTCEGNELIVNKLENSIEAGYRKYALGCGSNVTENKPMPTVNQKLTQP